MHHCGSVVSTVASGYLVCNQAGPFLSGGMHVRLTGDSNLAPCVNVSMNGCLSLCAGPPAQCTMTDKTYNTELISRTGKWMYRGRDVKIVQCGKKLD